VLFPEPVSHAGVQGQNRTTEQQKTESELRNKSRQKKQGQQNTVGRDGDKSVIALCREETGVLLMEFSEHLWPEDIESAIPVVHDVSRSRQNPLLLLLGIANDFDTSPWNVLHQILQPGILAQNRPARIAVLTAISQDAESKICSKQVPEVQIRFFSPDQRFEAKAWLLSFATPDSLPPILG
jgi:hypothetical protein